MSFEYLFRPIVGTSTPSVSLMNGNIVAETQVQNRVSGHETRIYKGRQGWSKGTWRIHQKGRRGGEPVTRCGREAWKICVVHVHNDVKWGNACTELRGMCTQWLSHKVDIVRGDGNQSWYVRSKTHKAERTDALGNSHPEPLHGLINTVARI